MSRDIEQEFSQSVRRARRTREMSQADLAHEMQSAGYPWHQTVVAKIEAGQRSLKLGEAYALARVLELELPAP